MFRRDMVNSFSSYTNSIPEFKQIKLRDGKILSELPVPNKFISKTIKDLNIRNNFEVEIILIKENGSGIENGDNKLIFPSPEYIFKKDDSILIIGSEKKIKQFGG